MTKREYEKWFCTPYITSVARQLEQSAPGSRARPVWSMAEAEARVLSRLNVLMLLLAVLTRATARGAFWGVLAGEGIVAWVVWASPVHFLWYTLIGAASVIAVGLAVTFAAPRPRIA